MLYYRNRYLRGTAIDGHTRRHAAYRTSFRVRKRIEEIYGWLKIVGGTRELLPA